MLNEALGWSSGMPCKQQTLLVKDSVTSRGSFVLHYLLKKILVPPQDSPKPFVIFIGISEPFSHYSRIARKQGYNLSAYRDSGGLVYVDLLSARSNNMSNSAHVKNKLSALFQNLVKVLRQYPGRDTWIIFDDISLLEVFVDGSKTDLLDFVHYCRTLSNNDQRCSLLFLAHGDVYETKDEVAMINQLELWADVIINVEPLSTGQSKDVHGQVIVQHRSLLNSHAHKEMYNRGLHYKIMENNVLFFAPGTQV